MLPWINPPRGGWGYNILSVLANLEFLPRVAVCRQQTSCRLLTRASGCQVSWTAVAPTTTRIHNVVLGYLDAFGSQRSNRLVDTFGSPLGLGALVLFHHFGGIRRSFK